MKTDKVILSSTTNPFYLDFWPIVSKIWKVKFNIHPVLILIHDDINIKVTEEYGTVIYQKPIEGVPVSIQAQCSRLFYPSTELETTWMTSDIDMLPVSTYYFIDSIKNITNDKFVNLNAHTIASNSICYNVAKGKTFVEVLGLPKTFEEFLQQTEWWKRDHTHRPGNDIVCQYWSTDESYCNEKLVHYHNNINSNILYNSPRPGGFCANRLDRGSNAWKTYNKDKIIHEEYLDIHSERPYSVYKTDIDIMTDLILKGKRK